MNSTTAWHPSVDTALFMLIHSITPPPTARPIITAPIHILMVLVCYRHTSAGNAGIVFPSWNAGKASAWIVAGYGLSIDTLQNYVPRMERRLVCHCVKCKPHHTFPDASFLSGFGLSTVTHPPGISGRFSSFGAIRPPQYELQPQSVIPGDPRLNDPATSSVTHPSVIPPPPPTFKARKKRPGDEVAVIWLISLGWTSAWNAFTKCHSRRFLS